jgi:peptidoglycan-associated lipoprotein
MLRKSAGKLWVLISLITLTLVAAGCAKRQVVKEEELARPALEAKTAEPNPEPAKEVEKPEKEALQAPKAAPTEEPKEEAKIGLKEESIAEAKPAKPELEPLFFDLAGFRILFAFDDYNLSNQARENLQKIASWMFKNPAAKIQIQGNTCNIGTAEYNLALGENRAMNARKYLQNLGVDSSRLSTISYGMEKPMFPNTDEANRSRNRRDEFVETK